MGCCGSSNKKSEKSNPNNANLNPIEQLKIRLASGEISIEEYLETKAVLENK